jgi:4-hydroxybenzoate polyprenyltransferase
MAAGMGLLAWLPWWHDEARARVVAQPATWLLLWGLLALVVAGRALAAVIDPSPVQVQRAVKQCILSLIVLDAIVALATAGPVWGLVVLALIVPATWLGRWIYST